MATTPGAPRPLDTHTAESPDARAERLLRAGLDIAVRLRDEDPARLAAELAGSSSNDLRDMVMLLAACVPIEQPLSRILAWIDPAALMPHAAGGAPLAPCGTPGGHRRHLRRGEASDVACVLAYRRAEAERKRQTRNRRRAA